MTQNTLAKRLKINSSISLSDKYVTDYPRFNNLQQTQSTGNVNNANAGVYKVFISNSGEVMGSYSTTSSQDSYRAINASTVLSTKRP